MQPTPMRLPSLEAFIENVETGAASASRMDAVVPGVRTDEITDMPNGSMYFSKPFAHHAARSSIHEILT